LYLLGDGHGRLVRLDGRRGVEVPPMGRFDGLRPMKRPRARARSVLQRECGSSRRRGEWRRGRPQRREKRRGSHFELRDGLCRGKRDRRTRRYDARQRERCDGGAADERRQKEQGREGFTFTPCSTTSQRQAATTTQTAHRLRCKERQRGNVLKRGLTGGRSS